jgi:hypothetical protein
VDLVTVEVRDRHVPLAPISDVTGVTGIAILRDIVAGQTDPTLLARHRHPRCKATEQEIAASLTGHYRPEHVFVLHQALELYDIYQERIRRCDKGIEGKLRALEADCDVPSSSLPRARRTSGRSANEPSFDPRSPLLALCGGVDLSDLPGLAPYGALKLVSEIGLDMRRWATEKRFAAWLTLAPRTGAGGEQQERGAGAEE